jgi:ferredoxin
MKIVVDRDLCTGQAMCARIAADLFQVADDGLAEIKVAVVPAGRLREAELAVSCCPNGALEFAP